MNAMIQLNVDLNSLCFKSMHRCLVFTKFACNGSWFTSKCALKSIAREVSHYLIALNVLRSPHFFSSMDQWHIHTHFHLQKLN